MTRIMIQPAEPTLRVLAEPKLGPALTRALDTFGAMIARATVANAALFQQQEWRYLAHVARDVQVPADADPRPILARRIRDGHATTATGNLYFGRAAGENVEALARRIETLPEIDSWALVLSLRACPRNPGTAAWWTLAARCAAG